MQKVVVDDRWFQKTQTGYKRMDKQRDGGDCKTSCAMNDLEQPFIEIDATNAHQTI